MTHQAQTGMPTSGAQDSAAFETSQAFRDWAGADTPVLAGTEIGAADLSGGDAFVVRAFHGTTHSFDRFSAHLMGNAEGAFGRVNYFTSSYHDAQRNYACEGMDLASRIENDADRLSCEIQCAPEEFDLPEDASATDCHDKAVEITRAHLLGSNPHVKEVYLRFSAPFLLDGERWVRRRGQRSLKRDTTPLLFREIEDAHAEAEAEVLADNQLDHLDGEAREEALEDLEEEVYERLDEKRAEVLETLADAVAAVASDLDIEIPDLPEGLFMDLDELTHQGLYDALMGSEDFQMTTCPETGQLISTDIFSRIVEHLGFDVIVLRNADQAFEGMEIPMGASHLHIFDSKTANILEVSGAVEEAPGAAPLAA